MNQKRLIEMCPKCGQRKPYYREVIGMGWIVCECDKPKLVEKPVENVDKKNNEPFVFKDTD